MYPYVHAPMQLRVDPVFQDHISQAPTATIIVFELPAAADVKEMQTLFSQFGKVLRIQRILNNRAALIEFSEISSPARLVHMTKINPFYVAMTQVRLEFTRTEIDTDESHEPEQPPEPLMKSDEPTALLNLSISKVKHEISIDVIKSICEPHGKISRIKIAKKRSDDTQLVQVEFDSTEAAIKTKDQIDGADIYSECCSLVVTYCSKTKLEISRNDSTNWDSSISGPKTLLELSSVKPLPPPPPPPPPLLAGGQAFGLPMSFAQASSFGGSGIEQAIIQSTAAGLAAFPAFPPAVPAPHSYMLLPSPKPVHATLPNGIGIGHAISNLGEPSAPRNEDISLFRCERGCVLLLFNLHPHLTCDHLFNLFCLYGNIAKIRFLLAKKNAALVQMDSRESADSAFKNYYLHRLLGRRLKILRSSLVEIPDAPRLGKLYDGSPRMKNYTVDMNNRFRTPQLSAKSRILDSARTLHFFNAPLNFTPPDLCMLVDHPLCRTPPRVLVFANRTGQRTCLGLLEWDSTEDALNCICHNNHKAVMLSGYAHPFHLKLAYSPKPISEDRNGMTMMTYPAPVNPSLRDMSLLHEGIQLGTDYGLERAKEIERAEEELIGSLPAGGVDAWRAEGGEERLALNPDYDEVDEEDEEHAEVNYEANNNARQFYVRPAKRGRPKPVNGPPEQPSFKRIASNWTEEPAPPTEADKNATP